MFRRAFLGVLALSLMLTVMLVSRTYADFQTFHVTFGANQDKNDPSHNFVTGEFFVTFDPTIPWAGPVTVKSLTGNLSFRSERNESLSYAIEDPVHPTFFIYSPKQHFGRLKLRIDWGGRFVAPPHYSNVELIIDGFQSKDGVLDLQKAHVYLRYVTFYSGGSQRHFEFPFGSAQVIPVSAADIQELLQTPPDEVP